MNINAGDALNNAHFRIQELECENTKLKEERENWRVSSVCRELEAENADLRRQKNALLALIEKAMDVIP